MVLFATGEGCVARFMALDGQQSHMTFDDCSTVMHIGASTLLVASVRNYHK